MLSENAESPEKVSSSDEAALLLVVVEVERPLRGDRAEAGSEAVLGSIL
jgi:hypothetical protein